jgi:hypothetical protein
MATKPTIALARFADQVGSDVVAPSGGLRDTGFVAGTAAVQSFVNELFKQHYFWDLYLNDGALVGNHTIAGTLGVSSALTVTAGGLVVSAGGAAITGALAVTGAAAVSTTLAVTGATTLTGAVGTNAINAAGLITANAGLTAGTNQNITLAGTGVLKHGTWTKLIVPNPNGPTFTTTFASMNVSVQNATVQLDQHFLIGDVITAIRIAVTDNVTGPTTLSSTLRKFTNGSGSPATVATSNTSSGAGTLQTLSMTGLSETITSGFAHQVAVIFASSNNASVVWTIEVDYTR